MTGFGAIVKSVERWVDGVISASERGLRLCLSDRRPKLDPIPVLDDAKRRRRRELR
jgi:hypothetical protein